MKLQTVTNIILPHCFWASHSGAQNCTCVHLCACLQICHPLTCEPVFCHADSELNSRSKANHKVFAGVYVCALRV